MKYWSLFLETVKKYCIWKHRSQSNYEILKSFVYITNRDETNS